MSSGVAASPPTSDPEALSVYIVERYWPGVTPEVLAAALVRARAAAENASQSGSAVRHLQSTLVLSEGVVFCLFEAASPEAVELVNRIADVAFDHVAEAQILVPPIDSESTESPGDI